VDDADGGAVTMLGSDQAVKCSVNADRQLVVDASAIGEGERPGKHAYTLKLSGFTLSLNPKAAIAPAPEATPERRKEPTLSNDLTLDATEAGLTGPGIRLEQKVGGKANVGFWDDPKARIRWQVAIRKAGRYAIRVTVATTNPSKLALEVAGQTLEADVPDTGGWDQPRTIAMGTVTLPKAGNAALTLRAAKHAAWKAVNVWKLELEPAK
jgi:hypothetical protein